MRFVAIAAAFIILVLFVDRYARAQEHRHPVQDAPLHEKFYKGWMKPDAPAQSCCNLSDCYPTEIRIIGGSIYARRREDGKFLYVAPEKVERNRDNPDGQSHMCAPPPSPWFPEGVVYCFTLGGGT